MDVPRVKPKRFPRTPLVVGGIAIAVLVTTLGLSRLGTATPQVEGATLLIDTVRRGEMVREVHGSGTLVPEDQRYVSALTAGRVERVLEHPGATVTAATVLLELSNPDVQLEALDAERQLKLAEADLASARANLESAKLAEDVALASSRTALKEAERGLAVATRLSADGLNSAMDVDRARDQLTEAQERHTAETRRAEVANESFQAQIELRKADVERLRAIAHFQQERVSSMRVTAGAAGVVQELTLQPGQWVLSGQPLARVVSPGHLKAVLQIPETEARDLTMGLTATIDTRDGIVKGHVSRIDPGAQNGSVSVDVTITDPLPKGARPDLSIDGSVLIDRLENVLSVGRPATGASETDARLFRLAPDGHSAVRVPVKLGRASFNAVEVLAGLAPGDRVILSEMSRYEDSDRVRIR